uniref:Uncharacterized protein n=1 Tax=Phaeomonas parva TaxID=124430 RepID=A0A7S1XUB0_9STRA|mmetsp:Transcript_3382/g.9865  ORF Transcript_3382/g.9865 Transcript_3382/m.9865 type:complete len:119 (+) Transcript_3382:79-435(+)
MGTMEGLDLVRLIGALGADPAAAAALFPADGEGDGEGGGGGEQEVFVRVLVDGEVLAPAVAACDGAQEGLCPLEALQAVAAKWLGGFKSYGDACTKSHQKVRESISKASDLLMNSFGG